MRSRIKSIASVYMIVYFLTLAHQLFPHHHNIEAITHPKDHAHDHHSPSLLANFLDLIKDIYEVDLGQNHLEEYLSNTSYQFNKQPIALTGKMGRRPGTLPGSGPRFQRLTDSPGSSIGVPLNPFKKAFGDLQIDVDQRVQGCVGHVPVVDEGPVGDEPR